MGAVSPAPDMLAHHNVCTLLGADNTLFDPAFLDAGFFMREPEADTSIVSHHLFSLLIATLQSDTSERQRIVFCRS